jgi:hypothetical protein
MVMCFATARVLQGREVEEEGVNKRGAGGKVLADFARFVFSSKDAVVVC